MKPKNCSGGHLTWTPKMLRVLVRSQCEITQHGLSNASLRIFELLGGMNSTCFWFMVYIPPINNQYGADGFKNLGSRTIGSLIQYSFETWGLISTKVFKRKWEKARLIKQCKGYVLLCVILRNAMCWTVFRKRRPHFHVLGCLGNSFPALG